MREKEAAAKALRELAAAKEEAVRYKEEASAAIVEAANAKSEASAAREAAASAKETAEALASQSSMRPLEWQRSSSKARSGLRRRSEVRGGDGGGDEGAEGGS